MDYLVAYLFVERHMASLIYAMMLIVQCMAMWWLGSIVLEQSKHLQA